MAERQARIRWSRKVEKVWREMGGNQDDILYMAEGAGYKTRVSHDINKARRNAQTQSRGGRTPEDVRGVEKGDENESISV